MNEPIMNTLASELANARRTRGVVATDALRQLDSFIDAYGIQERVCANLGARVAGWKLAAPLSASVISAPLFDIDCMASDTVLADAALLRDGVECELAFRIDRPLPVGNCTRDDVLAAVGAVMPAFELLCSRLPAKFASPREHIVADGMGNGAVVLGDACIDWRALALDKLQVTLWIDDVPVVDKQGGSPFGDPLHAVTLLANHLAQRGQAIAVGTFVLAGSHTGVHRAQPGERLRCVFEGIGQVALKLHATESTTSKENSYASR
ncbi:2-keto-4-pentenoate hydratase [Rhodoferax ferrireducens]|uniref:2-keto-4-pentenoate hydratase n=1 Tax=Rhodoferax ferrireducens TaxID=192843 RepID=A0ABU2C2J1_9BURK|nr:fumarylacetoacetate hydrolase family protein [Rhodoferax ferrireducens]MDR7375452.1 2-keto-4-pentenoate hydratase [Rhodoferax ferrireducens]